MDRQHDDHRRQPESSSDEVAGRLDRLSAEDAEAVIRRAIELTDAEAWRDDSGTLDRHTLEVVAKELGIDLEHLNQAMAERRAHAATDTGDDTRLDRLFRIDELDGAAIVRGNIDAVYRALVTWLTNHEGLRAVRTGANRGEWEKDDGAITSIKMGLGLTNASRALRNAGTIEHTITSLSPDEHVVTLEAGKKQVRAAGVAMVSASIVLAVAAALAITLGPGDLSDGILAGLMTVLAFGTGAVAIVRSWAGRISKGIRRALHAVTDPAGAGVFDRLPGTLGRFLRGLGGRR